MPLALASRSPGIFRATPAARTSPDTRGSALPIALAVLILLCAPGASARAGVGLKGCTVTHAVAVDSLAVSGTRMLSVGRALAQTFTPTDSLISSVSIWTPAFVRVMSNKLHLWITQAGADGRPDLDAVVADGGRLSAL